MRRRWWILISVVLAVALLAWWLSTAGESLAPDPQPRMSDVVGSRAPGVRDCAADADCEHGYRCAFGRCAR